MEKVVATRLSEDQLRIIDHLIENGTFQNRSQAIRELIQKGIKQYDDRFDKQYELLFGERSLTNDKLEEISSELFDKSVSELISEMRQ